METFISSQSSHEERSGWIMAWTCKDNLFVSGNLNYNLYMGRKIAEKAAANFFHYSLGINL